MMAAKRLIVPLLIVLTIGIAVAVFGKWEWLIWGIFLLCPLMHLFGHNHSGHGNSDTSKHHHHH